MYMLFITRHPLPYVWDKLAINNSPASRVIEVWAKALDGIDALSASKHSVNLGPNHLDELPGAFAGGQVSPGISRCQSKEYVVGGLC